MKTHQALLIASFSTLALSACSHIDLSDHGSGSSMSRGDTASGDEAAGRSSINENMATGTPANGEVNRNNRNEDSLPTNQR